MADLAGRRRSRPCVGPEEPIHAAAVDLGLTHHSQLPLGTVMPGAIAAIDGIRAASRFEMAFEDPVLGRTLGQVGDMRVLPMAG